MRRQLRNLEVIVICIIIWVVLNESITIVHILLGAVLGLMSLYITNHILLLDRYISTYNISFFWLLKYLLSLIIEIYIAGLVAIPKIVSGKINPGIIEIETKIKDDLHICLLANSITLTPGTVTVDKTDNRLKVLWIDCVTRDSQKAGELIMGKFEKKLCKD